MLTIYKYLLDPMAGGRGIVPVQMPEGAEVISCGVEGEKIALHALVHPRARMITREFVIAWTGVDLPPDCSVRNYVGTVRFVTNGIVHHVFDYSFIGPVAKSRAEVRALRNKPPLRSV